MIEMIFFAVSGWSLLIVKFKLEMDRFLEVESGS